MKKKVSKQVYPPSFIHSKILLCKAHTYIKCRFKIQIPYLSNKRQKYRFCIRLFLRGSRNLGKITGQISRPQFHLSLLGSLASLRTYRHLAAKVKTSKGGGKQWQTTPMTCPGCSVPEPYRSHDWALVPANPDSKAEY